MGSRAQNKYMVGGLNFVEFVDGRFSDRLRSDIRKLSQHTVLSKKWMDMSRAADQLREAAMFDREDGATERPDSCIRLLLEERKVSLVLRLLEDLNAWWAVVHAGRTTSEIGAVVKCERSLQGLLLELLHTDESCQLLHVPQLVYYVASVLASSQRQSGALPPLFGGCRSHHSLFAPEAMALLLAKCENGVVEEAPTLNAVEDSRVVCLMAQHFVSTEAHSAEVCGVYVRALCALVALEGFVPDRHLPSEALRSFKSLCRVLEAMMARREAAPTKVNRSSLRALRSKIARAARD